MVPKLLSTLSVIGILVGATPAAAQDARAILKAMSDYVGAQPSISATFESDVEVMTTDLEKIQFTSSGKLQLTRPDKLHIVRTGGYADIELFYDGKELIVRDRAAGVAAKAPAPGTIDALVDELRVKLGVEAPGADLILSKAGDALIEGVTEAKYIGRGVIDGVECEHLAFRTPEVDWQLWVAVGPKPIPHKYIITSKTVTGAPQYTLRIRDWSEAPAPQASYSPGAGDSPFVTFDALGHVDEIPPGTVMENKP